VFAPQIGLEPFGEALFQRFVGALIFGATVLGGDTPLSAV
jgi:hypothetical protein